MAYSGLETLYQNLGPAGASIIAGEREGTAQGLDELTAMKQRQEFDQAQAMNPLNVQFKQGEVAQQAAQLPGLAALSRKHGIEADVAGATKDTAISSTNEKNKADAIAASLKKMNDLADMGAGLAGQLKGLPPEVHGVLKQQFLQQNNIPPNSAIGQFIMNKSPDDIMNQADSIKKKSAAYLLAEMQAKMTKESHLQAIASQNASHEKINQANIEAGKYAKKGSQTSFIMKLQSTPPATRLGNIKSILDSGIDPSTNAEISPVERAYYESMYAQDKAYVEAKLGTNQQAGIVGQVGPAGGITLGNKPVVSVSPPAASVNKTKSGISFKVLPQ